MADDWYRVPRYYTRGRTGEQMGLVVAAAHGGEHELGLRHRVVEVTPMKQATPTRWRRWWIIIIVAAGGAGGGGCGGGGGGGLPLKEDVGDINTIKPTVRRQRDRCERQDCDEDIKSRYQLS